MRLLFNLISKDIYSHIFTIQVEIDVAVMNRIRQADGAGKFTHICCPHQRLVAVLCKQHPFLVGSEPQDTELFVKLDLIWFLLISPGGVSPALCATSR